MLSSGCKGCKITARWKRKARWKSCGELKEESNLTLLCFATVFGVCVGVVHLFYSI